MVAVSLIPPEHDAFGLALADHLADRPAPPPLLLEEGDGRIGAAMAPFEFFTTWDQWTWWEREILADLDGPVLDLGCGAGRHALHLQQSGLAVTALDISPGAVAVSRRRGLTDVRHHDLRDPPGEKRWTTVLLMCGNLGVAGGWEQTRQLFRDLAAVCAPGARIIGDTVDPSPSPPDTPLRLHYGDVVSPWWTQRNVPFAEVPALAAGTGWTVERQLPAGIDHAVVLRLG